MSPSEMFKSFMRFGLVSTAFLASMSMGGIAANAQPAVMTETITVSEVKAAQNTWCDALVAISKAHDKGGIAK